MKYGIYDDSFFNNLKNDNERKSLQISFSDFFQIPVILSLKFLGEMILKCSESCSNSCKKSKAENRF